MFFRVFFRLHKLKENKREIAREQILPGKGESIESYFQLPPRVFNGYNRHERERGGGRDGERAK